MNNTGLAGVYQVSMSLKEMNKLMYEAATAKRVRMLALRVLDAVDGSDFKALELATELIRLVGIEEGWAEVRVREETDVNKLP